MKYDRKGSMQTVLKMTGALDCELENQGFRPALPSAMSVSGLTMHFLHCFQERLEVS